jgi:hypothetical protein
MLREKLRRTPGKARASRSGEHNLPGEGGLDEIYFHIGDHVQFPLFSLFRLRSLRFGSAAGAARSHHCGPIVGVLNDQGSRTGST